VFYSSLILNYFMLFLSRVKGGIHLSVDNSCDLPTMCVMHKIMGDHKSL